MSKMKSSGTAYLCFFLFGCQYAYLGKWGLQFLYWFTLGGVGIWAFIDLFHIPTKISNHNMILSSQIESIERRETEESHSRNIAMMAAATGNRNAIN